MNEITYLHCFWFIVSYGWEMFKETHSEELALKFYDVYMCGTRNESYLCLSMYNPKAFRQMLWSNIP